MSNAYRVPKRRVQVIVELPCQGPDSVGVFLSEQAGGHAGPERPGDLFDGPDEFLVVARQGEVELVRRDQVVTVAVQHEVEHPSAASTGPADLDERVPVVVTLDDGTVLHVPDDFGNRHRQELQDWLDDGNTLGPADPPPPPPTNDEIYDQVIQNRKVFKGYVLAVNDGSIVPGSNMTGTQLKAAVKAKM